MKVIVLLTFIIFLNPPLCQAQTENDNLFSLDLSYFLTGLLNQGWGIGLNYKEIKDYVNAGLNFNLCFNILFNRSK